MVRISDKLGRIENLLSGADRQVDDETLLDSIGDLATYSIMMAAECAAFAMSPPDASQTVDNTVLVRKFFRRINDELDHMPFPVPNALADAKMYFRRMEQSALDKQAQDFTVYSSTYQYARMLAVHMTRWVVYGAKE